MTSPTPITIAIHGMAPMISWAPVDSSTPATPKTIRKPAVSISAAFLDDLDTHGQAHHVAGFDRPLLVIHAVDDEGVPISEGDKNFAAAQQPKGFVPLLHTDHLVMSRSAAELLTTSVTDWLDRTL